MTPQEIYDDALALVNVMRGRLGMEPLTALPRGIPGDGGKCPIRRALGNSCVMVEDGCIEWNNYDDAETFGAEGKLTTATPRPFVMFMGEFDEEKFPDLIDQEELRVMIENSKLK